MTPVTGVDETLGAEREPVMPATVAKRKAKLSRNHRSRGNRQKTSTVIITRVVMAGAALYFLFPVWWLIVSSSKSKSELYTTNGLWFGENFALFNNLNRAMDYDQGLYLRWIGNSITYAAVASVVGVLISVAAGYALAKLRFPGRNTLFVLTGCSSRRRC